ncbi:cyclase family protein [Caldinitratiruptor microaerophilus]|uniref:Cyclase n=1 Tax=Caldinitratiruptor microaerophilus TaxID=671077 RepID=A0AA35CJF9_9FIRM|nr:cyclase family protein [Caldinitratiruptor microaerophilus]BDG60217.1 cyclase [Caldinitratiruptor microaerophilus]
MRIVDLTHGFRAGMPAYGAAWYARFDLRRILTPDTDPAGQGRTFSQFVMNPHNATHVDAPSHFFPGAPGVAELDPAIFLGPAVVADLTHKGLREPITAADLDAVMGGEDLRGLRLLVRTDYLDRHWGDPDFWQKPPYLDATAAAWCVERGVRLVGLDCLTEEPGDRAFPVHRSLLGAGIPILEYIRNLAALRSRRVWLSALPIVVHGAEAAPVRAVALEGGTPDGPG